MLWSGYLLIKPWVSLLICYNCMLFIYRLFQLNETTQSETSRRVKWAWCVLIFIIVFLFVAVIMGIAAFVSLKLDIQNGFTDFFRIPNGNRVNNNGSLAVSVNGNWTNPEMQQQQFFRWADKRLFT